jgi:hypothetical protein
MAQHERPNLQPYPMPAVSYYALPPFLVAFSALIPYLLLTGHVPFEGPEAWLCAPLFAVYILLVGIPALVSLARVYAASLQSADFWRNATLLLTRMIYILKVPDAISARHGWFKYVYYGSFIAYGICTILAVPAHTMWIVLEKLPAAD